MDYLFLIVGLVMMYRRNYPWMFAIIIVLASTYLQLPLRAEMQMMIGPEHNVADTGLLLYVVFWGSEVIRRGFFTAHPLAKAVSVFLLFLLLNGLFDILCGTSVGDVIRYLKNWVYLSIVFVDVPLQTEGVKKTVKILFWITFGLSLVLTIQYVAGAVWIGYTTHYVSNGITYARGAKPPSFSVICFCIAFLNILNLTNVKRIVTSVVLFLPILFTLKMSYFTTIVLILIGYYLLQKQTNIVKLIKYGVLFVIGISTFFTAFPIFHQRFQETVAQLTIGSSTKKKEGNFSYRIDHFSERLDYVLQDPVRSARGMGYIQERNFHENLFKLGQPNNWGSKAQLDTADIAWSLLIIRLGILGLIFYFLMYYRCLHLIWSKCNESELNLLFFCYMLVSLVFMSFGNTLIAQSDFFIIPFLICDRNEDRALHLEPEYRRC